MPNITRRIRFGVRWPRCLPLVLALGACSDGGAPLAAPEVPFTPPVDTTTPPVDTTTPPIDTTTLPPPDTSTTPPPDTTVPPPPAGPPEHVGIPFGASLYSQHQSSTLLVPPSGVSPSFNALKIDAYKKRLLDALEAARRANGRILVSFSGSSAEYTDGDGFNLELWKRKVDEFRDLDLSGYVDDGTLMGHYIMDEPQDTRNWNGHQVARAEIDEMARYSKEIWPGLPTIIRGWAWYLKGYNYKYLDAAWAAYHVRFGPIDQFIEENVRDAKAAGLSLVVGLNVVAGGGDEGLPGYHTSKNAMTASQLRTWGNALLDEPYGCAFFMFRFNPDYFGRNDIQEAVADLSAKAHRREKRSCLRP